MFGTFADELERDEAFGWRALLRCHCYLVEAKVNDE